MCSSGQTLKAIARNVEPSERAGKSPDEFPMRNFDGWGASMNTMQKLTVSAGAAAVLLALGGCAGMSQQEKNTAIGAGVGAVGGAVITGGSAVGTGVGAAVGGVIGHEIDRKK
jgi:osmotically inducible lipoprotein OsmB